MGPEPHRAAQSRTEPSQHPQHRTARGAPRPLSARRAPRATRGALRKKRSARRPPAHPGGILDPPPHSRSTLSVPTWLRTALSAPRTQRRPRCPSLPGNGSRPPPPLIGGAGRGLKRSPVLLANSAARQRAPPTSRMFVCHRPRVRPAPRPEERFRGGKGPGRRSWGAEAGRGGGGWAGEGQRGPRRVLEQPAAQF